MLGTTVTQSTTDASGKQTFRDVRLPDGYWGTPQQAKHQNVSGTLSCLNLTFGISEMSVGSTCCCEILGLIIRSLISYFPSQVVARPRTEALNSCPGWRWRIFWNCPPSGHQKTRLKSCAMPIRTQPAPRQHSGSKWAQRACRSRRCDLASCWSPRRRRPGRCRRRPATVRKPVDRFREVFSSALVAT